MRRAPVPVSLLMEKLSRATGLLRGSAALVRYWVNGVAKIVLTIVSEFTYRSAGHDAMSASRRSSAALFKGYLLPTARQGDAQNRSKSTQHHLADIVLGPN